MILQILIRMYITMMPVILAGILNMIWVKTPFVRKHHIPMDRGILLRDHRRLLGDNKTWLGFFGMVVAGMIAQTAWGAVCKYAFPNLSYLYYYHDNTVGFNLLVGAILGLTYMVFELPNSFIKRRIGIPDGKTVKGNRGVLFFVIDQIDSLIGDAIVFTFLYPMPVWQFFAYLVLGAGTHIIVNLILYKLHIRKNL